MSENNLPKTTESVAKNTPNANSVVAEESKPKVQPAVAQEKANEVKGDEEEFDDEEYEVEYVYEDEEEEVEETSGEVIEVDEESDPTERQQETLPLDDDDEEIVEVYEEYDEEEEVADDAEFDRIANRIDELLSKTSTLQANSTTPTLSAAALTTEPISEISQVEKDKENDAVEQEASPALVEASKPEKSPVSTLSETPVLPIEVETKTEPVEAISKAVEVKKVEEEEVDDEEYEVEYVDEEEEEEIIKVEKAPLLPPPKKASPPIERSSTVEDSQGLSLPGQLRHFNNQLNISDLHDEEDLESPKSEPEEVTRGADSATPVLTLGAIKEEESIAEADNDKEALFFEQVEPREMPARTVNRFTAQTLSEAMADEDEVNEIEIALEDWKEGDLEGVQEEEEELEEEDENDEVDPVMPDNLLLHANDQIEQIDVPLTPSPTPSSPGSPPIWRPVSPSSLILSKVRNLVIAGQLQPLEELLTATPNFFIDAILKAGWTALLYASYRGYPDIVNFCLKRGSDPNYHKEFFTSLMAICSSGNGNESQLKQCMDLLIEHGAQVNATDKFGCSPLHYAARFGRAKLTESLIEQGANVNHSNRNGWTALHWAAAENHEEVVATLLDHNADVLLETRDGVTAGELAAIRKNEYIAEALHDFEDSELKVLAEAAAMEQTVVPPVEPTVPAKQEEPKLEVLEEKVNESVLPPQQSAPSTETPPSKEKEIKRELSVEEIESRKEEAREIVINAIDAALARDIGKLMSRPNIAASTENELRQRPIVLDDFDEDNEETGAAKSNESSTVTIEETANEVNVHNVVISLAVAAAIFFFFKLMWYFSS